MSKDMILFDAARASNGWLVSGVGRPTSAGAFADVVDDAGDVIGRIAAADEKTRVGAAFVQSMPGARALLAWDEIAPPARTRLVVFSEGGQTEELSADAIWDGIAAVATSFEFVYALGWRALHERSSDRRSLESILLPDGSMAACGRPLEAGPQGIMVATAGYEGCEGCASLQRLKDGRLELVERYVEGGEVALASDEATRRVVLLNRAGDVAVLEGDGNRVSIGVGAEPSTRRCANTLDAMAWDGARGFVAAWVEPSRGAIAWRLERETFLSEGRVEVDGKEQVRRIRVATSEGGVALFVDHSPRETPAAGEVGLIRIECQ